MLFTWEPGGRNHEARAGTTLRGGFFRRCGAFLIDGVVVAGFLPFFFYLLFVGYGVGLAANLKDWSLEQMGAFLRICIHAGVLFLAGYFFVLHRVGGQTVGKWIMGLKVVGHGGNAITYGQSAVRLLGYLVSAFLALGFLWILWSREKRGWHDFLAGTWVIRTRQGHL